MKNKMTMEEILKFRKDHPNCLTTSHKMTRPRFEFLLKELLTTYKVFDVEITEIVKVTIPQSQPEEIQPPKVDAKVFLEKFNRNYPFIQHDLKEKDVDKWLSQKILKKHVNLMDLFQDYVMSQGLGTLHGE